MCVQGRCVCAIGRLGARCAYTSDMLVHAARARARREQERVRNLHLCLSAWRGGESTAEAASKQATAKKEKKKRKKKQADKEEAEPPAIRDGTPLSFALCRHQSNQHQQWSIDRVRDKVFRIRSVADAKLCVTAQPVDTG